MLDTISHNELINLFTEYTNSNTDSFFIVNKQDEIIFANKALENYIQKPINKIIDSNFGLTLGCMYLKKDNNSCGNTYYCSICKIRNTINDCFNNPKSVIRNEVVRDFKINDEVIFKQMNLTAYYVEINNQPHVAISIIKVDY